MSEAHDFDPDALREKYRHERDRRLRPDGNDQYIEVAAEARRWLAASLNGDAPVKRNLDFGRGQ